MTGPRRRGTDGAATAEIVVPRQPPASRRRFGGTWWGRAWLAALEQQAALDPNRLPRGRTYARSGAVGDMLVRAGSAAARVRGSRPEPYRVVVRVARFGDEDWARVFGAMAGRLGHAAALLDGELPPDVVDDVARAGLSLLPGPRDITVDCTCPDRAVPCKHAAAVCYVLGDLMDTDPFAVLLLRGRGREDVLSALRTLRGNGSGPAAAAGPATVPAADAYARATAPLPRPLPPPAAPGTPVPLPPSDTVDVEALTALATAAAARAAALLG
ncbi:MAG TPA: SWIM zinc finger family protein [Actinocatenispora sp.]